LGKDVPSRFLAGELCGPLKDQGFEEGSILFLPETNLVIEEVRYSLNSDDPFTTRASALLVFWGEPDW